MIRIFVLVGIIGVLGITYNTVFVVGPISQVTPPKSLLTGFRAKGFVPALAEITMSDEVGHGVFEEPEEDAVQLKMAMQSMGGMKPESMPGMKPESMPEMKPESMPGMKMESMPGMKPESMPGMKPESMPGMKMEMKKEEAEHAEEKKDDEHAKEGMAMKKEGMPGMVKEAEEAHGEKEAEGGHGGGSVKEGLTVIAQGTTAEIDRELAEKGLKVDSVVEINMKEWEYGNAMVMAQTGQVLRLKVKNTGSIPHEFMLMNGPGMNAVDYRLRRADWNLLEHEALAEVPLVLPGRGFEMVVQIHKSGMWMYMCMFPYHMQMGMMGMLMTPDMMGKMGSMGGMGGMKM
ncbi:MAG: multicopper oxidase domain-containing protein [Rhodospirillales bacterium]|nr:multicopper oxidase domain-containing protein [Rhodospirillales bacterium]